MDHYLSEFPLAHSVLSAVTPGLVFFNKCYLTNVNFIKFKIKDFELVARCLNQWKNTNCFGISLQGAPFLCLRQHLVSVSFQTAITGR